jgi:tetratricopeptide (TPR) repeat protein
LETHPDHPETLSLKALFLLALGEEAKALEIGKLALMKSKMKSLFCWHTCGTIYKGRKDFLEAAKCFQNALRM